MIKTSKYLSIFVLLLATACTTQKNTGITRTYHNLTSRYNILFNGKESYKKGMLKMEESYDYNFNKLIPVFLYTDENQLGLIGPEMDRAIKKATKLISMHSLTAKPEYDPNKNLSEKQKEFLNKKEYNKYADDAYLLMGKAHFYKFEYGRCKETFNYVVANFEEDVTAFESKIWLARLAIEEDRFREANEGLEALSRNMDFPKELIADLEATLADYNIYQEDFEQAIVHLTKAIEFARVKAERLRYTYLLAQLYEETENASLAIQYYNKVVKMNPPYKMAFSAKIRRALAFREGTGGSRDIEKQMNKMLRDDKNIEYQDQIYFALGNLYFKQGQSSKAIENYKFSLATNAGDIRQRAITNLTLADLYYSQPDYINAQAYYDSAVAIIDPEYPNYDAIYAKATSLNLLVEHINTVELEDSVIALSYKSRSEIDDIILDLIDEEIRLEEEKRNREIEQAQERFDNESTIRDLTTSGSTFYFYNVTAKNLGKKEFVQVWGNRKLEDNWRRRNKSTVSFYDPQFAEQELVGDEIVNPVKSKITDRKSPDFYLQNIPFTDSARQASNNRISNALYQIAEIYNDDLKDYAKAIDAYEELIRRYPLFKDKLQVYYKLYTIAKEIDDNSRQSKYQNKIINEYPESTYAKLMTNPNYVEELLASQQAVYTYYQETYKLFDNSNFAQVRTRAQKLMRENPDHELFPKFDYMYVVSSGIQKDTLSFVKDLQEFEARYPSTDLAGNARLLINYLQNERPDVVVEANLEIAKSLFVDNKNEVHYFAYIIPKSLNSKQLSFNILNYNLDNFDDLKLEIKRSDLDKKSSLLLVEEFSDAETASDYLKSITLEGQIFKDVNPRGVDPVIISKTNYSVLSNSGNADQYLLFYRENY